MSFKEYNNDVYSFFKPVTRKVLGTFMNDQNFGGALKFIGQLDNKNQVLLFELVAITALGVTLVSMFITTLWIVCILNICLGSFIWGAIEEYTSVHRWNTNIYNNVSKVYESIQNKTNATTTNPSRES